MEDDNSEKPFAGYPLNSKLLFKDASSSSDKIKTKLHSKLPL
jgi:hypothetical protein